MNIMIQETFKPAHLLISEIFKNQDSFYQYQTIKDLIVGKANRLSKCGTTCVNRMKLTLPVIF